jgi:NAD(P)-dependent dehydrogenase (short-subunit alcohol dehydrogenase family)
MKRLAGKVAIVTGGTGGVGQAITELFAKEGAKVAVFDVAKKSAAELLERIAAGGGRAAFYEVDITSSADVERAVLAVRKDLGPVDILVNNAAIPGTARLTHEATAADFDEVFAVNVKGTFLCTKFVVANMLAERRKGSIVNISSTYGMVGNADIPLYHATKAAVLMMTKSDGVTYAEEGIRFNAVLPGSTRAPMALKALPTPRTRGAIPNWRSTPTLPPATLRVAMRAGQYSITPRGRIRGRGRRRRGRERSASRAASMSSEGADYIKNLVARHPMKRQAEPIEIAHGVLFLASDEASYITGTQLAIDGGYTAQ